MKVPHFYVRYYCEKEKNVKYCAGQLKYLIAIKELKEKGGRIRCVSISEHLGVSRPSVSKMLRCLVESGLVREDFCTSVELTEKGEEVINEIYSGYAEVYFFFKRILRLSSDEAREQAQLFVTQFPKLTTERLSEVVSYDFGGPVPI